MEQKSNYNPTSTSLVVNQIESGLPHWLIKVGFVLMVVQAICVEDHLYTWIETHGLEILRTIVFLSGDFILFYAMMRGMRQLSRPYTWMWWALIVADVAGCLTFAVPNSTINLALAIAQPLFFLPLGISIAYFYRGLLQWVGILLVAHMVTIIIFPTMLMPFIPFILIDIVAILTQMALAWVMLKVLI